jgi:hypothetical protein
MPASNKNHPASLNPPTCLSPSNQPAGSSGGVIQYDFGKTMQGGRFARTGSLNKPPGVLLTALTSLQARHMLEEAKFLEYLSTIMSRHPKLRATAVYQDMGHNQLFGADYDYQEGNVTCEGCDVGRLVHRPERSSTEPAIYYSLIAPGN